MMTFFYWMMTVSELLVRYLPITAAVLILTVVLTHLLLR